MTVILCHWCTLSLGSVTAMIDSSGPNVKMPAVANRGDRITDLGCPGCSGVLAMEVIGENQFPRFVCLVGHAFASDSLLQAKEDQLERALWTAIETYEEIRLLCVVVAEKSELMEATRCNERAKRAAANSSRLRELLAEDRQV